MPKSSLPRKKNKQIKVRVPKHTTYLTIFWENTEHNAFVFDITQIDMAVFCTHKIPVGETVKIRVDTLRYLGDFHARVVWAALLPSIGHIIRKNPYIWRLGLQFTPKDSSETVASDAFCAAINRSHRN